ncbi:MAG: hypothetical protein ACRBN8_34440 [Nannocystales bacterium]
MANSTILSKLQSCTADEAIDSLLDLDWAAFSPRRDLHSLQRALMSLERREGLGGAHHIASERLLEQTDASLVHNDAHRAVMQKLRGLT